VAKWSMPTSDRFGVDHVWIDIPNPV